MSHLAGKSEAQIPRACKCLFMHCSTGGAALKWVGCVHNFLGLPTFRRDLQLSGDADCKNPNCIPRSSVDEHARVFRFMILCT